MPAVLIEVRRQYSPQQEVDIIDAVHQAMMSAIKIPDWDKTIRLIAHEPHRFACPAGKGERYTLISFDLFPGRSLNAKRNLYRSIVENLEPLGIPREEVMIVLREAPPENWGIRGGQAASDVTIDFKVDV